VRVAVWCGPRLVSRIDKYGRFVLQLDPSVGTSWFTLIINDNLIIYHESSLGISSIGKPRLRRSARTVTVSSLQSRPRAAPAPRVDATAKGRQRPKTLTASRGTWGLPVGAALSLTNVHCERRHLDDERRTSSALIY
jgi:hypothetical protein